MRNFMRNFIIFQQSSVSCKLPFENSLNQIIVRENFQQSQSWEINYFYCSKHSLPKFSVVSPNRWKNWSITSSREKNKNYDFSATLVIPTFTCVLER